MPHTTELKLIKFTLTVFWSLVRNAGYKREKKTQVTQMDGIKKNY